MRSKSFYILLFFLIFFYACIDDTKRPSVITNAIIDTTWEYFIASGEVINDGGSPVTAKGFCISTDDNTPPTIVSDLEVWHTNNGSGIGSFTDTIRFVFAGAGHIFSQKHHVRAYATNSQGTAYGKTIEVFPMPKPPKFSYIKLYERSSTSVSIECEINKPGQRFFPVDEFYFCYGPNPNPTIEGMHSIPQQDPRQARLFLLNNLNPNTTYYLRGYIKNISGFAYSNEIRFSTFEGEVTDIDGNVYPTKTIGNQVWMASNLIVSKYNDGTKIPSGVSIWDWGITETPEMSYQLYNYYAVIDSRKLCPTGWHIPSDEEWKTMEIHLGMSASYADLFGDNRGSDEGGKLKAKSDSTSYKNVWEYPNSGATNSTGFSAKGIPWVSATGERTGNALKTGFWTCSEFDPNNAINRVLLYNSAKISRNTVSKKTGLTIRCIKD